MKSLIDFTGQEIHTVFTDIDDTVTDEGQLRPEAYAAMWRLAENGIRVVPVTGRPAGWCEMIARFWPVAGVVGENGGFYFRYNSSNRKMLRHFALSEAEMSANRKRLELIRADVARDVPKSAIASDQFSRLMDLAVDFAEDVGPLPDSDISKIVSVFEKHGAVAKVSSIHVNGWFGAYDKLSMARAFCERELGFKFETENTKRTLAFCGDSPNDEPMFQAFQVSFAVANIKAFLDRIKHKPAFVTSKNGGHGFVEIVDQILKLKGKAH